MEDDGTFVCGRLWQGCVWVVHSGRLRFCHLREGIAGREELEKSLYGPCEMCTRAVDLSGHGRDGEGQLSSLTTFGVAFPKKKKKPEVRVSFGEGLNTECNEEMLLIPGDSGRGVRTLSFADNYTYTKTFPGTTLRSR